MTIKINDFCELAVNALDKEGKFSGEEFRENVLRPAFNVLYETVRLNPESKDDITINLDGTFGYSYGWLEEVFGGMILYNSYPEALCFSKHLYIFSSDEPYQIGIIIKIIKESLDLLEKEEKKTSKSNQSGTSDGTKNEERIVNKSPIKLFAHLECKSGYKNPCWCCADDSSKVTVLRCEHGKVDGFACIFCDEDMGAEIPGTIQWKAESSIPDTSAADNLIEYMCGLG